MTRSEFHAFRDRLKYFDTLDGRDRWGAYHEDIMELQACGSVFIDGNKVDCGQFLSAASIAASEHGYLGGEEELRQQEMRRCLKK